MRYAALLTLALLAGCAHRAQLRAVSSELTRCNAAMRAAEDVDAARAQCHTNLDQIMGGDQ